MPEPETPKSDKEMLALAVRVTVRLAAAVLVSTLLQVILVAGYLMLEVSFGDRFSYLKDYLPVVAAVGGLPTLAVLKGPVLFFTALGFAIVMYAGLWYFQTALFVLWGIMTATAG